MGTKPILIQPMSRTSKTRQNVVSRWFYFSCLLALLGFLLYSISAPAQDTEEVVLANEEVLTNASQILSLPAEQAILGKKVLVTGVVTAAEPNWDGRFFVQDASGGIFVGLRKVAPPVPGDVVEVTGNSHPGAFAPTIMKPHWRKVGTAPLPAPKIVPIEQLMAGSEDSQRVEVVGIIREAGIEGARLRVTLANGGYRLRVYLPVPKDVDPQTLVGSRVRVRGTAAASFIADLRHLVTMILYVPVASDFIIEQPELTNPFDEPMLPLKNIAQYRRDATPDQRVHVKGTVTYQRLGQDIFIKDATGGLHIKSLQVQPFAVGDVIEVVGFPGLENYLPVLQDAIFHKTSDPRLPVEANPVSVPQLQAGLHHADFIAVEGTLLDRNLRPSREVNSSNFLVRTVLLLQSSNFSFTAEAETPTTDPDLESIPIGSRIEVRGVCLTENGDDEKFKSLQVLLPSPENFTILHKASWLTPGRLGVALAVLGLVSIVAFNWIIMISRKNSELNVQIREKEHAQAELQNAHDQLEARVKERTEQLKIQIAARKESELQFKGVLAERTRLAQELHDTLEQTLASIALQLDTCSKLSRKDTDAANYHFELGRTILAQSQVDVRRSVWDLRSRALEQFNLRGALATSSKQITEGTGIAVQVSSTGVVRPLPEIIEENLLRIAQEALTNIIKHSRAERADISLDYSPQSISLQIADNGAGFAVADHAGPRDGHFGLLGISERAQRLGGKLTVTSTPDSGTVIRVEIPTELSPEVQWAEVADLNEA
jgi:signal transduction histidine kinase